MLGAHKVVNLYLLLIGFNVIYKTYQLNPQFYIPHAHTSEDELWKSLLSADRYDHTLVAGHAAKFI